MVQTNLNKKKTGALQTILDIISHKNIVEEMEIAES